MQKPRASYYPLTAANFYTQSPFHIIHYPLHTFYQTFSKYEYSLAGELHSSCPKTLTSSCLECLFPLVKLNSHPILHKTRDCNRTMPDQDRTEGWGNFKLHVLNFSKVRPTVWGMVLREDRSAGTLIAQCKTKVEQCGTPWAEFVVFPVSRN
jgi:hypothetical protein